MLNASTEALLGERQCSFVDLRRGKRLVEISIIVSVSAAFVEPRKVGRGSKCALARDCAEKVRRMQEFSTRFADWDRS